MEVLFILFMFGIITMILAQAKGYSGAAGFFSGFLLGIFGLLIFVVMPKKEEESGSKKVNP